MIELLVIVKILAALSITIGGSIYIMQDYYT